MSRGRVLRRFAASLAVTGLLLAMTAAVRADEFDKSADTRPAQIGAVALTLGTPAGINLTLASGLSPRYGLYMSGMYWSGNESAAEGIQMGVLRLFKCRPNHFQAWLLSAGTMHMADKDDVHDFTFAGISHIWKWKGLYTQVDLMIGSGDYPSPQIGLQLGVALTTIREALRK